MLTVNLNVTVIIQPRGNGHFRWRRDSSRPFTFTFTVNIFFSSGTELNSYLRDHIGNLPNRDDINVNLMYSTPSCYLKAIRQANQDWPIKEGDFFPYASDPHAYWTGQTGFIKITAVFFFF